MRARAFTLLAVFFFLPFPTLADTIYSYVGPAFQTTDPGMSVFLSGPYTPTDFVSGHFDVATPLTGLGNNSNGYSPVTNITHFKFTDGVQTLDNTNSVANINVGTSSTPDPVTGFYTITYWNISFTQLVCSTCGNSGSSISNLIVTVAGKPASGATQYTWSGGYDWMFNPYSHTYNEG